jgi:tetratricopeptide (TPR) repeat protein
VASKLDSFKHRKAGLTVNSYFLQRGSFKIAQSLLTLALECYERSDIKKASILADILVSLATLGIETTQESAPILAHALQHLKIRIDLNEGGQRDQELLSMAHCRLAQAYMHSGEYAKAINHCRLSKAVLSFNPESCVWSQWLQVFQAWCLIAMSDLEEAETVICAQFQYQSEHSSSEKSGSLMYDSSPNSF